MSFFHKVDCVLKIPLAVRELRVVFLFRPVAVLAVAMLSTAGCRAYRPLSGPPVRGNEVRVTLRDPQNLVGQTEGGKSVPLNVVTELRGSIASVTADTIRLFVSSTRGPDGATDKLPAGVIVAVPRDWHPRVQEPYKSVKPLIWGGLAVLAALSLAVLALAMAIGEGS